MKLETGVAKTIKRAGGMGVISKTAHRIIGHCRETVRV